MYCSKKLFNKQIFKLAIEGSKFGWYLKNQMKFELSVTVAVRLLLFSCWLTSNKPIGKPAFDQKLHLIECQS